LSRFVLPFILMGFLAWAAFPFASSGAVLRAGVAESVITPDVHTAKIYMAGFGYNRVATGVHDNLYVRCLALSAGPQTLGMCEADIIGLFYDDVLAIRRKVEAAAPSVSLLIVASSHDHEGPDTLGLWGPDGFHSGIDEAYLSKLDDTIAATALRAIRSLRPARLILAKDTSPLLALLQDDSRPPYVKDPCLLVMQLDDAESGKPITTLVNWSDHPETLSSRNTLITADFPHRLCKTIHDHGGGMAVFFQGSCGGLITTLGPGVALQDPVDGQVAQDGTWEKAKLVGDMLGRLALRAVKSGRPVTVNRLVIRRKVIFIPLDNERFRIAGAAGIFKGRKELYTNGRIDPSAVTRRLPAFGLLKYETGQDVQSEVDYIQLRGSGRLQAEIAAVPGEIYPELVNGGITRYPGADFPRAPFEPILRQHMKSDYKFVLGLANDELGYIIPKAEWDNRPPWLMNHKTRWYGEINSCGPDAAETITETLVSLMGDGR
jgi:hypothetical protein